MAVVRSYFFAFALILSMVICSVCFDNNEFILPEIAAMAVAMWAYRNPDWLKDPLKICLAPTFTSIIGLAINQLELAYLAKVSITLVCILLFLSLIRSSFAPSLATGLLPLITNGQDWTLVLLIFAMTLLMALVAVLFRLNPSRDKMTSIRYKNNGVYLIVVFLWLGLCWITGYEGLAAIPPILVVVYESIQKKEYSGKMALKQGVSLTVSAGIGTLLYFVLDSMILITLLDILLMLLLQKMMNIRMPAIYAFPLLPFILPGDIVANLPLGTALACLFMFGLLLIYKKYDSLAASTKIDVSV